MVTYLSSLNSNLLKTLIFQGLLVGLKTIQKRYTILIRFLLNSDLKETRVLLT